MKAEHDALGLMAARLCRLIRFGDVEVSAATTGGQFKTAHGERPAAEIDLDLDLIGADPIDYFSPVTIDFQQGDQLQQRIFTGAVVSAQPQGPVARVEARTAPEMQEQLMAGMVVEHANPLDVIHAIARSAGTPEDRLSIEGLDELPNEMFEVVVPVFDVVVERRRQVGPAWLAPRSQGLNALAGLHTSEVEELDSEFRSADSYLFALVEANLLYHAEERGLSAIELALAWLATRARYGLVTLPSGDCSHFYRSNAVTTPSRGSVVVVRGLLTRRRWLRNPDQLLAKEKWQGEVGEALLQPELPETVSGSDRQALAALRIAIIESDPVSRVQSLWEAIEAYASGTSIDKLFSGDERERLIELIPEDFNDAQQERLINLYKGLNNFPVMTRLRWRLEEDSVPMSDEEMALLRRLRSVRNPATHGGELVSLPQRDEIEHAISVVARMLVFRTARQST